MRAGRPERTGRALLVLLALLSALLGGARPSAAADGPPSGSLGIRLLDAPVTRREDPRASLYVIDHVEPGTMLRRRLQVVSTLPGPARVELYAGAAALSGGRFVGAEGRTANELSGWVRLEPSSLTVPAGGRADVEVTLSVPSGAGGGERYGVLWAEARGTAGAVTAVSRVGVRTYLSVGGPAEPASDFVVERLTAAREAGGQPVVQAVVRNTGGRALDLQGELTLTAGPGGAQAGPFPADTGTTLAVGASAPVTVRLDPQLPEGPWTARLALRSGLLSRVAEARLSLPRTGSDVVAPRDVTPAPATPAPAPEGSWFDRALEVLAGLLAVLLLLLLRRRRRREDAPAAAPPAPPQVPLPTALPAPLPRPRRAPAHQGATSASSSTRRS